MDPNPYQQLRTQVKRNLRRVTEHFGMEYAIRAETPVPLDDAEQALRGWLENNGFHVIHETDVKDIHNHYDIEYPEFKILKVVRGEHFMACPMASTAVRADPDAGSILPPSIVMYELDGVTRVSAVRPSTLLAVFSGTEMRETIVELESHLWDALEHGLPHSRMLSTEPPLRPGQPSRRRKLKESLSYVASLVDAELTFHVSSSAPPAQVKQSLTEALGRRGQRVLGEVADGRIMLVVNPGQAHKALAIDPDIAVFAPLSVSITQEDGRTHVRTVRPSTLLLFAEDPDLQDVLLEMELLLWNSLLAGVPDVTVENRQPPLVPMGGQRSTAGGLPGGLGALKGKYARLG